MGREVFEGMNSSRERKLRCALEATARIGTALASVDDVRPLLGQIVGAACDLFTGSRAAIALFDKNHETLTITASAGEDDLVGTVLRPETSILGAVAVSGIAEVVLDPQNDPRVTSPGPMSTARRAVYAPLRFRGVVLGAIAVGQNEGFSDALDDEQDVHLLALFADLAASVLQADREIRDERSMSGHFARIGSVAAQAELEMGDSVEALLREIASATHSTGAAIAAGDENEAPRLESSWNLPAALRAAWQADDSSIPKGENGFEILPAIGAAGPWSDLAVRVPRRGRLTTLHIVRDRPSPPSEADLRLTAVVAIQLAAMLDRNELLEEIRASSEAERSAVHRLRDLYEDIAEGILVLDLSGKVTFASRRACHILHRAPNDLIGHGLLRFADAEDRDRLVAGFLSAREGSRVRGEFGVRVGGSMRIIEYTGRGESDAPTSAVRMVLRDVTEDRRREADTLHREKLASVGQLAAGVAHEINNPISFVLSNYSFLARRLGDLTTALGVYRELARTPEAARYALPIARMESGLELDGMLEDLPQLLADSLDGLERVRRIVGDMRVFARKDPELPVQVDVGSIVDIALGMATPIVKMRAKVVREVAGTLPPLQAWPGRLTQCVLNLVVNAAQAIPAGAADTNRVTVRAWSTDQAVFIAVGDTGTGIRPEDRAKLFTPFYTTKSPGEGTGLGLALAWDAIRRHGGTIGVESAVGRGTTFTITLPFGGIATAAEPDASASLASTGLRLVG